MAEVALVGVGLGMLPEVLMGGVRFVFKVTSAGGALR
jgi:hypothetical protein